MSVKEILIKAKELINTPEKWMQEDYHNDDKTCFCTIGAVAHVSGVCNGSAVKCPATDYLRNAVESELKQFDTVAVYNDTHTHADVMAMFDKAIEAAAKDEADGK